nr:MAG TPA: hypothetical protein [Caudoviricetes sp.]
MCSKSSGHTKCGLLRSHLRLALIPQHYSLTLFISA